MKTPKRILAPIDFSDVGQSAIDLACDYARHFKAELHLLHVVRDFNYFYPEPPMMPAGYNLDTSELVKGAKRRLAKVPGSAGDGLRIQRDVVEGPPADAIVEYAEDNEIDVIVICTRGMTGLQHLLLGSVAERVVRLAPCIVMTVRPECIPGEVVAETPADIRAQMRMLREQQTCPEPA